jgi:phosphatidate cytidylyltransferase
LLKYRILSALVMIPAAIAGLFLLSPTAFALALIVICMLAAWEWGQFAGFTKQSHRVALALITGILLVWLLRMTESPMSGVTVVPHRLIDTSVVQISLLLSLGWWLAATGLVLTYPKSAAIWHRSTVVRLFFGALTIVPFFFGMITLREYGASLSAPGSMNMGAWSLLYVMFLVWGADSGAYAFGRMFGKHKLAPKVSPGKTWEGVIGGLFTAALLSVVFSFFIKLPVQMHTLLICSIIAVIASVLGDLTESMFKREAGIKDSSHLIPGHGGVLDRLDSLTAAIPVFTGLLLLSFR